MDIKDIQNLIKFVAKSGAQEVKLEMEDVKITIKTGADPVKIETGGLVQQLQAVPVPATHIPSVATAAVPQEAPKAVEKTASDEEYLITIKSPIIGTFYRKAAPDKPAFR